VILVYAVTSGRYGDSRRPPLRHVAVGSIGAVVQRVSRGPRPSERAMREFDRVVASIAATVPALLPARFGTTFADVEELTAILKARQPALRRALRHVRGRVQMTTRVVTVKAQGPRPKLQSQVRSGAEYLRRRAAEREVPGFPPLRAAVRRWVRDEHVEQRNSVASVYHLIPRASVPAYRRALQSAADDAGLRVIVSGPWPPYAFATTF
jgi:hypothetical protein